MPENRDDNENQANSTELTGNRPVNGGWLKCPRLLTRRKPLDFNARIIKAKPL